MPRSCSWEAGTGQDCGCQEGHSRRAAGGIQWDSFQEGDWVIKTLRQRNMAALDALIPQQESVLRMWSGTQRTEAQNVHLMA